MDDKITLTARTNRELPRKSNTKYLHHKNATLFHSMKICMQLIMPFQGKTLSICSKMFNIIVCSSETLQFHKVW